ncbi:aldo/keto reductase [Kordia algicida OT-1]|uniref:Oxidoreductase, aldo/keto reductase family protein n=1 Tax=Kordia algicida OT-1 TaxID=391587 RepID=A9DQV1_9FLAO|nr:aldo/keto reductase [Kordia algicida]EDP96699.1 oxidoreductase, aldo/keto reductase family protein [Kordia algicida OT-1]
MNTNYSRIIAGTMTWGIWGKQLNTSQMIELMHHCKNTGITTFDHADIYGGYTTEADFGKAFAQSGIHRESIEIISKCGIQYQAENRQNTIKHYDYSAAYIIWSVETSLQHLQTDYLDLLLLHRPSPLMHPDEIAKAIDQLKSQGKIKNFGVSNFTPSQMTMVGTKNDVSANQIQFSLTDFDAIHDGTLDFMITNSILPMAWQPLGSVFREETEQTKRIHKVLDNLTEKYNATKDQLVLAWILKHPSNVHPVIGTTTPERITNASKATEIDLSLEDWFTLLVESQGHKVP